MSEEYLSMSAEERDRSHQISQAIDKTLDLRIDAIVAAQSERARPNMAAGGGGGVTGWFTNARRCASRAACVRTWRDRAR